MEGGQTNEFRPLILVAEDDDSNFTLLKAIIGKKCDIPVSYTHLDVYKRQAYQRAYDDDLFHTFFICFYIHSSYI